MRGCAVLTLAFGANVTLYISSTLDSFSTRPMDDGSRALGQPLYNIRSPCVSQDIPVVEALKMVGSIPKGYPAGT